MTRSVEKLAFAKALGADLLVLPEHGRGICLMPGEIAASVNRSGLKKGICVVCNTGSITAEEQSGRLATVLPVVWRAPDVAVPIRVLAIWATDYDSRCLLTTWRALDVWQSWLLEAPSLILGDFNQSVCWDKFEQPLQFRDIIDRLRGMGFRSAYHDAHSCDFGNEADVSLRWRQRAFHIDYVFISAHFDVTSCELRDCALSDHSAVVADLVEANDGHGC